MIDVNALILLIGNGVGFGLLYFLLRQRISALEKQFTKLDKRMWEHVENPLRRGDNDPR